MRASWFRPRRRQSPATCHHQAIFVWAGAARLRGELRSAINIFRSAGPAVAPGDRVRRELSRADRTRPILRDSVRPAKFTLFWGAARSAIADGGWLAKSPCDPARSGSAGILGSAD